MMKEEAKEFMKNYATFVDGVTSTASKDTDAFVDRVKELQEQGVDVSRLLTASEGLSAEAGEFTEIPKKILFQGKPYDEDNVFHMKRELGDIMWYWMQACIALNLDPVDVIEENVRKLEARWEGGSFDVFLSENRKEGDL